MAKNRGTKTIAQQTSRPEVPASLASVPEGYGTWLADVKARIRVAQTRACLAVNHELIVLYWSIGRDILDRQQRDGWGTGVVDRVSVDLRAAFPNMSGFSRTNIKYMRAFAEAWPELAGCGLETASPIGQPLVGQLPWVHNIVLLTKLKSREMRLAYAARTLEHGWSRAMLTLHIEQGTVERSGMALTNFDERLPKPISDLARETLKDPYVFDFLSIGAEATERELEDALVSHISRFLIELGAGFAYVGRQVHIEVDGRDFFIDLLFYHLHLRCFVVVELKAGEFEPEHAGKLGFYLSAVDSQMRGEHDAPTIGLLLCKTRRRTIVEYALRDTAKPMGIAEYQLVKALPKEFATSLPSIEQIEAELENHNSRQEPSRRNEGE